MLDECRKGRRPTLPGAPFSLLAPNTTGEADLELITLTCLFKSVLECAVSDLEGMADDKFSPFAVENRLVTGLIGLPSGCSAIGRAEAIGEVTGSSGVVKGAEYIASMAIGFLEVASEPKDILEIVL